MVVGWRRGGRRSSARTELWATLLFLVFKFRPPVEYWSWWVVLSVLIEDDCTGFWLANSGCYRGLYREIVSLTTIGNRHCNQNTVTEVTRWRCVSWNSVAQESTHFAGLDRKRSKSFRLIWMGLEQQSRVSATGYGLASRVCEIWTPSARVLSSGGWE